MRRYNKAELGSHQKIQGSAGGCVDALEARIALQCRVQGAGGRRGSSKQRGGTGCAGVYNCKVGPLARLPSGQPAQLAAKQRGGGGSAMALCRARRVGLAGQDWMKQGRDGVGQLRSAWSESYLGCK